MANSKTDNKATANAGCEYQNDKLCYNAWYSYEIDATMVSKLDTKTLREIGYHLRDGAIPSEKLYALAQLFERLGM